MEMFSYYNIYIFSYLICQQCHCSVIMLAISMHIYNVQNITVLLLCQNIIAQLSLQQYHQQYLSYPGLRAADDSHSQALTGTEDGQTSE